MYIDDATEKIFNEYKNKKFSEIYLNNEFKFLHGEKTDINESNDNDEIEEIEDDESSEKDDSLNESFFQFYQKEFNLFKKDKNEKIINEQKSSINKNLLIKDEDENENNDSIIELYETITLSNDSDINKSNSSFISKNISKDILKKNNKDSNNIISQEKNQLNYYSNNKEFFYSILDRKKERNNLKIEGFSFEEKGINKSQNIKENKFLTKKRDNSKYMTINNTILKKNDEIINNFSNKIFNKIQIKNKKKDNIKRINISKINDKDDSFTEEIIELSQSSDNSSFFIPIDTQNVKINDNYSYQKYSNKENEKKQKKNISFDKKINKKHKIFLGKK